MATAVSAAEVVTASATSADMAVAATAADAARAVTATLQQKSKVAGGEKRSSLRALFLARRRDSDRDVLSSLDLAASGLEIRWASGEREELDWKEEELHGRRGRGARRRDGGAGKKGEGAEAPVARARQRGARA